MLCRERRCHCLMIVCCCNCFSERKKDQHRPAYAAMGELFSQVCLRRRNTSACIDTCMLHLCDCL